MKINFDNKVIDYMNTVVNFIGLNLVFLLFCLPIVTIGPALAALYQVTLREARGEHGYLIRKFVTHFKEMFVQAFFTFVVFTVLLFISVYSIVFWNALGGIASAAASMLFYLLIAVLSAGLIYVFPLMARFSNTFRQTIKNAFLIALSNMKATLLLLLIQVFVISLLYLFPVCKVFMLIIGFSFVAFCNSYILTKVFKQYEPDADAPSVSSASSSL